MKHIDVKTGETSSQKSPWLPWGAPGALWRYVLFLALLVLFCALIALPKSCSHDSGFLPENKGYFEEFPDAVETPDYTDPSFDDTYDAGSILDEIIHSKDGDTPYDGNINNPSPNLPTPDRNRMREIPDDEIINNPDNPYKRISGTSLGVMFDNKIDEETFNQFATQFKQLYPGDEYSITHYNKATKLLELQVPAESCKAVHDNLNEQIPDIDFRVFYIDMFETTGSAADHNDPAFSDKKKSWYFAPIQAYDAWDVTTGSSDVTVAIIDNYIDVTHPELRDRIVAPYSVERQSKNVLPPPGVPYSFKDSKAAIYHGTHVAATAVGALDNGQGTSGIAPQCKLMPISLGTQITNMKILDALLYAIYNGADVVNLSLANYYSDEAVNSSVEDQINYSKSAEKYGEDLWNHVFQLADENNVTIVWAGGNQNIITGMDESKRNPSTIRVSAVDHNLRRAEFSNYGSYNNYGVNYSDISAPGVDIYNAGPHNIYGYSDGTSMAAPIVTGAVALMKSINPNLTNAEIIKILKETARKLPETDHAGGLLQIRKALDRVTGQAANFDEIKNDKNKLIGNWTTTELQDVVDSNTRQHVGQTHIKLHFDTPERGYIAYVEPDGTTYRAPFTSKIGNSAITVTQTKEATAKNRSDFYEKISFKGTRGKNGLLECSRGKGKTFYLIRQK